MRVLWFSITPAKYGAYATNGGGWIESLQRVVSMADYIDLGIAFMNPTIPQSNKVEQDGVTYYPMHIHRSWLQTWKDIYTNKEIDPLIIQRCKDVISDFRPDVIHIFGSEWCFGLLYKHTDIPVVIHMQGCWPAYWDKEKALRKNDCFFYKKMLPRPRRLLKYWLDINQCNERAVREEEILQNTKHFMGRTSWDKALMELYAPKATYYYCSEALRGAFIDCKERWSYKNRGKRVFVSTGLATNIKGYETLLKAAALLKRFAPFDFEWRLMGPTGWQMSFFEHKAGVKCEDVNVVPCGNQSADAIMHELLNADCYVHPSSIDNSPNAVCEAQFLGLPVVATNVGGVRSLFAGDYDESLLIAPAEPHIMANQLIKLMEDENRMINAAESNYTLAHERHADENILRDLSNCYSSVINNRQLW